MLRHSKHSETSRNLLVPWQFLRRVLSGNFSCDKTLCDVSRFQIEMAIDRTDLAGHVETRDRLLHGIQHSLLNVVLRTALRVVYDGPGFHDIKRRSPDR